MVKATKIFMPFKHCTYFLISNSSAIRQKPRLANKREERVSREYELFFSSFVRDRLIYFQTAPHLIAHFLYLKIPFSIVCLWFCLCYSQNRINQWGNNWASPWATVTALNSRARVRFPKGAPSFRTTFSRATIGLSYTFKKMTLT